MSESQFLPRELRPAYYEYDGNWLAVPKPTSLEPQVYAFERTLIQRALSYTHGNRAFAARHLEIPRTTLLTKMKKFGLT